MGWIIFIVSVVESFIGYILVWGNMSYWGASVIINILAIVPFIGPSLVDFIWCSSSVVLNFAITIHFLIGLILVALIVMHILYLHITTVVVSFYYSCSRNVSSSSPFINSSSSLTLPFFPIFFKDLLVIILLFWFSSYNFFYEVEAIYGNVQNLIPASPTATPTHILPEWQFILLLLLIFFIRYFLLFYSILRAFPSKVYGAIMVLLFFIFIIKTPPFLIRIFQFFHKLLGNGYFWILFWIIDLNFFLSPFFIDLFNNSSEPFQMLLVGIFIGIPFFTFIIFYASKP